MGRVAPPFRESPVMLRQFAVALVVLLVLDTVWLGVVMKDFYRRALAPVARMADGQLDPIWPVAALVYPVLAHRMILKPESRLRKVHPAAVVKQVVDDTRVPVGDRPAARDSFKD